MDAIWVRDGWPMCVVREQSTLYVLQPRPSSDERVHKQQRGLAR